MRVHCEQNKSKLVYVLPSHQIIFRLMLKGINIKDTCPITICLLFPQFRLVSKIPSTDVD